MKNIFKIIILSKIILLAFVIKSYAEVGAADTYKVTMKSVELCTGSSGVTNCEGSVTIGSGGKEVDIAAVDAGASAASYGDAGLLPLGTTYTHMRVVIDRKFGISAGFAVSGVTADCNTTADLSGSSYPGGSLDGTERYDRMPVEEDGQTQAEATLYLKNNQMKTCTNAACSSLSGANTITYAQGTGSSLFQTQHDELDMSDNHVMVYKLSSPYTVALIPPTIDISFGTSAAIKITEVGTDLCMFDPQEPVVTITIN